VRQTSPPTPPPREFSAFIATGPFLGGATETLCSFRFADLRHSGTLSLVVAADSSGRMVCGRIYVIDKTSSELEVYDVSASWGLQQV
jgi:hypothetical protein